MSKDIHLIYIDEQPEEIREFKRFVDDKYTLQCFEPTAKLDEFVDFIIEKKPDILVVDYQLNEYNPAVYYKGTDFVEALHKKKYDLPCLILTSFADDAIDQSNDPNTIHFKGELDDPASSSLLLRTISRNVAVYRNKIASAEKVHHALTDKIAKGAELTIDEQSLFIENDEYLEKTTYSLSKAPSALKATVLSGQLDELIRNTRLLIKESKKKEA
ncbi:response regulator transcription factor [Leucothrix sargassi]|nr:response regulator transcription factor [Leucothrix sargassi]